MDDREGIGERTSEDEALELLEATGHGVLSMGDGNRGYGVPVSFGYDETSDRFVFEFLNVGDSEKQSFASATEEATLTVYEYDGPADWTSAIVTGTLESVDAADLSERAVAAFTREAEDAAEEVRWAGAEDLDREWYALDPTDVTGRRRKG